MGSSPTIPTMTEADEDVLCCHRCQAEIVDDDWYFFYGTFWCFECREHIARIIRRVAGYSPGYLNLGRTSMTKAERFTDYEAWRGRDAYDADGTKIGTIEDIYYDDVSRRPEWVAIKTGLFGMKRSLAPIGGSSVYPDPDSGESHLQLRLRKDQIKDAPQIDVGPGDTLSELEEQRLYEYYGHEWAGRANSFTDTSRVDQGYDTGWDRQREREGDVVAEETVVNERVQKTEQPRTVRLRKYQWTEQVPVQHEEVRMEEEGTRDPTQTTRDRLSR